MDDGSNYADYRLDEPSDFADDDADDGAIADDRLFRKVGERECAVPLAFTVQDAVPPRMLIGHTLAWTSDAMATFAAIYKSARNKKSDILRNFPYAYLRGSIEVSLDSAIRIERDMGLGKGTLDDLDKRDSRASRPFAYLERALADEVFRCLKPLLHDWVVHNLIPRYAEPGEVDSRHVERLQRLIDANEIVVVKPFESKALPWSWDSATGTTKSTDSMQYQALADLAAKTLAGHELFPGTGPMLRRIASSGKDNEAELLTRPIPVDGNGFVSLVVRLSVETVPGLHQPLLVMHVSKRRWLADLHDKPADRNDLSGVAFSSVHQDRAFGFQMVRQSKSKGGGWIVDNTFEALRRKLDLPLKVNEAAEILAGRSNTGKAMVYLVYRDGVSKEGHAVLAGVPEADKLDAFKAASKILQSIGMRPFQTLQKVKASHSLDHKHWSRMISASTLLSAMLQSLEDDSGDESQFAPEYLQTMSDDDLRALLLKQFGIGLERISRLKELQGESLETARDQIAVLDKIMNENRNAIRRMFGDKTPMFLLFHDDTPEARIDIRIVKALVALLWGDLTFHASRLPQGTHGPEAMLDPDVSEGKRLSAAKRSERRIEAWGRVTGQMRQSNKRVFCLVMARKYYEDAPAGSWPWDDRVNKPSTRRALATAGAAVQFVLPCSRSSKDRKMDIKDFLQRLQAAMKDLVSAHWGRFDTYASAIEDCFPDTTTRPKEIIGITVVRKQAGRVNHRDSSFLPVAIRLDAATGRCALTCCYESKGGSYERMDWKPFPEALSRIAGLSPVKLAHKVPERQTRFMRFVKDIVSESVDHGANPVILIDSSTTSNLWPWLRDTDIRTDNITIGEHQWMQDEWKGARIIRIRHGLAPSIVIDKLVDFAITWAEDDRPKKQKIGVDLTISRPTAPTGGLYRLGNEPGSGCRSYFSVGRKMLHSNKRGVSCYRKTKLTGPRRAKIDGKFMLLEPQKNTAGMSIVGLMERPPFVGQWPSPNLVEIVVALRQQQDDPDLLAKFVERLRYGYGHYQEWTSLPAPLFFERVVRDYISHFGIEDAESSEAEERASES